MKFRLASWLFVATLASGQANKPIVDNERVTVWDNAWTKDQPGFAAPAGKSAVNPYAFGAIRFNTGNRSHREVLTKGSQRAIMMELK